jgi:hypothetical protein
MGPVRKGNSHLRRSFSISGLSAASTRLGTAFVVELKDEYEDKDQIVFWLPHRSSVARIRSIGDGSKC